MANERTRRGQPVVKGAFPNHQSGIFRIPLLAGLNGIVALMGPARIYSGEHWASDVLAGYLLGSPWLALSVKFYNWGRTRSRKRQQKVTKRS